MGSPLHVYKAHRCSFDLERTDAYLRLGTVTVYVCDQERSLPFYLDHLGFQVAFDTVHPSGERWLAVTPPDGTAVLSLVAPRPGSEEHKLIGGCTDIVFLTDNLPAKFREWRERGVRFLQEPCKHPWGGVGACFEDPDGNSFTLLGLDQVSSEVEMARREHAKRRDEELHAAHELELARQVQTRLFPQIQPTATTLEYAGTCIQARHVGGDYYDFLDLGRDRLGLLVADVSGKGTAAALLMANLQAHLHNQISSYWNRPYVPLVWDQPERFLRSVNRLFHRNTTQETYATLFFAEYDDKLRRLRYANCGHLSGLLLRQDGGVESLDSTCTGVGLFNELNCVADERSLSPGDTLALYTDGVTESRNAGGEEFGEERLVDSLQAHRDLPSHALLGALVDDVRMFGSPEQHDDITVVIARCRPD
ncbi:MAG TPA: SpoIIE family protein phosphatase [Terriglobales bacterium]|nr:SpoIIE family protein phosphatase [Terriglobales bacterium]